MNGLRERRINTIKFAVILFGLIVLSYSYVMVSATIEGRANVDLNRTFSSELFDKRSYITSAEAYAREQYWVEWEDYYGKKMIMEKR